MTGASFNREQINRGSNTNVTQHSQLAERVAWFKSKSYLSAAEQDLHVHINARLVLQKTSSCRSALCCILLQHCFVLPCGVLVIFRYIPGGLMQHHPAITAPLTVQQEKQLNTGHGTSQHVSKTAVKTYNLAAKQS